MDLLIPYKPLKDHNDPCLEEFTYGDANRRAKKLLKLKKGDHLFFHTGYCRNRYVTAYYVVDRSLNVLDAVRDKHISAKYKNPHITKYIEDPSKESGDVIVFGDPILSRILQKPVLFNRRLAKKLSFKIPFSSNRTDFLSISSATRSWRELSSKQVNILLNAAKKAEQDALPINRTLSTEEVTEILERDIEAFIQKNPSFMGPSVKIIERQLKLPGGRIDLLLKCGEKSLVVAELKLRRIGHDAVRQTQEYIKYIKSREKNKNVSGIIVCQGVMPAFQEELGKLRNIRILCYGWQFKIYPWKVI